MYSCKAWCSPHVTWFISSSSLFGNSTVLFHQEKKGKRTRNEDKANIHIQMRKFQGIRTLNISRTRRSFIMSL